MDKSPERSSYSRLKKTTMKVKPLAPDEVFLEIPDFVIEAVNTLLRKKWDGTKAVILQEDILNMICNKEEGPSRTDVFDYNWLDFENLYREAGWLVKYDHPGYNENYKAYFEFKKKRDSSLEPPVIVRRGKRS